MSSFSLTDQAKKQAKSKIKKKVMKVALVFVKPFIIPILILLVFLTLVSSITDILYIAFDNDDKIDMTKELAYYDTIYQKENDKQEVKGFFQSVWEFVDIFLVEVRCQKKQIGL